MEELYLGRYNKLFGWRSKVKEYSLTLGGAIHMIDLVWLIGSRPIYATYGNDKITKKLNLKKKLNCDGFNIS